MVPRKTRHFRAVIPPRFEAGIVLWALLDISRLHSSQNLGETLQFTSPYAAPFVIGYTDDVLCTPCYFYGYLIYIRVNSLPIPINQPST